MEELPSVASWWSQASVARQRACTMCGGGSGRRAGREGGWVGGGGLEGGMSRSGGGEGDVKERSWGDRIPRALQLSLSASRHLPSVVTWWQDGKGGGRRGGRGGAQTQTQTREEMEHELTRLPEQLAERLEDAARLAGGLFTQTHAGGGAGGVGVTGAMKPAASERERGVGVTAAMKPAAPPRRPPTARTLAHVAAEVGDPLALGDTCALPHSHPPAHAHRRAQTATGRGGGGDGGGGCGVGGELAWRADKIGTQTHADESESQRMPTTYATDAYCMRDRPACADKSDKQQILHKPAPPPRRDCRPGLAV
jgi:hypothetical protein